MIENISFPNIIPVITYYVGRNKEDNFHIIDLASPNDIWIHAYQISSAHVIISLPPNDENEISFSKKQMRSMIKKGADLCKQYTNKIRDKKKVEFIYTKVKNVVKTEKIGEVKISNEKKIIF